ncbi:hypothetical protein C7T94_18860 [Pedobacter yulinensis]|uniref:histidine kinase n=1 Tax=Pedobacter yulinensis TaxID=2126353 RepID=A0A2T3HGV6_9SPHI|nr:HAMP domain-containing sensor histidine kinase [Pedobacter yulinensis]PST81675.1 hypothetical protein C7T94_18860 [Pedobacter yulinensis]
MNFDHLSRFREAGTDPEERMQLAMHELKTPLTVIKAYLQLMAVRADREQLTEFQSMIDKTEEQVRKVVDIIYAIQEAAEAENADLNCVLIPFDLAEAVAGCAEAFKSTQPDRSIELDIQPGRYLVNGDRDRLEQVLSNLLTNAVKYTNQHCVIRIGLKFGDDCVVASVSDNGPGIPEENQYRLFDRHYRVEGTAENAEGKGLGLYVCAEVIRRHHGRIGIDSVPGQGASFWFSLPLINRP